MPTILPPELAVLTWGCILAFVHILAAAQVKTRQYGTKWNMGARDEELPPLNPLAGRLARAQANFFETFPVMIAAVFIVGVAGRTDSQTALGAWLWLGGRVAYLPLYALGVPYLRTLAWVVSLAGIIMVLKPAVAALF
ncbi:MAG TPA: MAPEG family protein [Allosphingosinicella sp.]|nr:MAPEG family protein [Allosphingosinicella sp.]